MGDQKIGPGLVFSPFPSDFLLHSYASFQFFSLLKMPMSYGDRVYTMLTLTLYYFS